jgi:TonB-dependent SusC/RagA subfamily outer membrane receptor
MKKLICIILTLFCCIRIYAQDTKVVYGNVNILNDLPVNGIEIYAKKSKAATATDSIGNFVVVCKEKDILVFKSKCFSRGRVRINDKIQDTLNVKLGFVNTPKNIDIAIGYGYVSESNRVQAVDYLEKGKNYCNYHSIYELIRNNFTGLTITTNGCIIVRGVSTLYSSPCATYVVDGVFYDTISFISPCDVKEISLLKDGGAAIYGTRGSNGVFIINLKDGN